MPLPRQLLLLALPACLVPGLLLAAATSPAPVGGPAPGGAQYTIQPGDTLNRIAQKHGLTPDALAQANAIDKSQRIVAGNVLRLPVTPPASPSPQPVPFQPAPAAKAADNKPEPGQAAPPAAGQSPGSLWRSGCKAGPARRACPARPSRNAPAGCQNRRTGHERNTACQSRSPCPAAGPGPGAGRSVRYPGHPGQTGQRRLHQSRARHPAPQPDRHRPRHDPGQPDHCHAPPALRRL